MDQHVHRGFEVFEEVLQLLRTGQIAPLPVAHGDIAGLHKLPNAALEAMLVPQRNASPGLMKLPGNAPGQRFLAGYPKNNGMTAG